MRITQSGLDVGIALDYGGADFDNYSGLANPGAKKPEKGELAIVYCGTNDLVGDLGDFDELGRMSISTKLGKLKASFKGTTIFSDFSNPGPLPALGYTCKWKYVRTSFDNGGGVQPSCQSMITFPSLAP